MRKKLRLVTGVVSALLVATVLVSCDDDDIVGIDDPEFRATLTGGAEVPPTTSTGTGFATFEDEGTHFEYTLSVTGLTQVTAAHIHGPATTSQNANVVINLFIPNGPTGAVNGVIATGIITDAQNPNLSVSALRTMINNGTAYVNVHTTPLPNGAIRGQIVVD
jgi:hypothetical protein